VEDLAARGIVVRCPSMRGVAEEAPGAYKEGRIGGHRRDGASRLGAQSRPVAAEDRCKRLKVRLGAG
jgi:tRNA-splicing ligase RtcB